MERKHEARKFTHMRNGSGQKDGKEEKENARLFAPLGNGFVLLPFRFIQFSVFQVRLRSSEVSNAFIHSFKMNPPG